ncbi:molybdopterin-synthase adenylyltransferase MoeB [Kocuria rhizophila]|uniref:molybdopterin-synthase adenylyltransferase MoeB n=1 Tax=Kocuria rhizophila TaxID=72000 RepID=UPI0002D7A62D|nr:molybdopterin-synthase adenylyltransferase MoeB [Kocuria rhizophila]MBO4144665.1 molybdopterin-synthase adenylyltransferase MoeB [Kocuria rhizophila]MCT1957586.1 molybdopterin-synthase adenylyltransferase MoeB [Kocuria rhizophila]MCT2073706.1 molybdopterin-synthase adenylyltransferase MoeB [Kocuria rhizophila]MDR7373121.1 adenylyltransferase/sulfurtransferase [Kocuria rhizophila]PKZ38417.1 molybdopterin-synthase adenylyltransferase MoeB [Kocuria rhizophila]
MNAPSPFDPLVEPGAELTREELERYSRHLTLAQFGPEGQRRLKNARVLVVGAGGLGAPALQYLAAAGVGTLGVVDDDVVSVSNLQRQVIHTVADVGRPKVDSAADAVARLNPLVTVRTHDTRLSTGNALEILGQYDLVLDGADNFATRYLVADAAELTGIPVVWGSILRFDGQVSVFWAGRGPVYRDLYPEAPPAGSVPSCAEGGVLGVLPATIGSVMATEALKLLTGLGAPLVGRVLVHDALAQTWRTLTVLPDPERQPVTDLSRVFVACGLPSPGDDAADPGDVSPAAPGAEVGTPPAAPSAVETVDATELARLLEARERGETAFTLVDVREDWERQLVSIPGSVAVPLDRLLTDGVRALPAGTEGDVILHCKAGVRSAQALAALRADYALREDDLKHLDGGILAWIEDVDPSQPRY